MFRIVMWRLGLDTILILNRMQLGDFDRRGVGLLMGET